MLIRQYFSAEKLDFIQTRGDDKDLKPLAQKLEASRKKLIVYFDGIGKPLKDVGELANHLILRLNVLY